MKGGCWRSWRIGVDPDEERDGNIAKGREVGSFKGRVNWDFHKL